MNRSTPTPSPRRIVVFRIGQLGDTIVALPAFWALRQHYPHAQLFLLADRHADEEFVGAREVLPQTGLFDGYLSYPAVATGTPWGNTLGLLMDLRARHFDLLVYLAPRTRSPNDVRRDLAFFRLAGIRRFIGHRGFTPLPVRSERPLPSIEHESDHLMHRLRLDGVSAVTRQLDLRLTAAEVSAASAWLAGNLSHDGGNRPLVAIAPSSKWLSKRWPFEYFVELGRVLIERFNVVPMVVGSREDTQLGLRLIAEWGSGINAAGALTIRECAAVLERCALYVGNDTGSMHLAAAAGTTCVAVFSAQDWPGRWHPLGSGHTVLRERVPCEGCMLRVCDKNLECLTAITPRQVADACEAALGRQLAPSEPRAGSDRLLGSFSAT